MTDKSAAAIDGDYSNFQLVQSRKVCRIVIEFPIERADEVVRLLGWPKPHSTTRCAVALLTDPDNARGASCAPSRDRRAEVNGIGDSKAGSIPAPGPSSTVPLGDQGKAAEDAPTREDGVVSDATFLSSPAALSPRKWHQLTYAQQAGMRCNEVAFWRWLKAPDKPSAEQSVREWCGVTTRADLDRLEGAGEIWAKMDAAYQAWQRAPAMGADQ